MMSDDDGESQDKGKSGSWSFSSPGPVIGISDPSGDFWDRFKSSFQWIFGLIVGAMLIGFITMLFMVAGLVVDAWNYRNTTAKDNRNFEVQSRLLEQSILQQEQMLLQLKQINEQIANKR